MIVRNKNQLDLNRKYISGGISKRSNGKAGEAGLYNGPELCVEETKKIAGNRFKPRDRVVRILLILDFATLP